LKPFHITLHTTKTHKERIRLKHTFSFSILSIKTFSI
jgi:hypothetical protein